MTISVAMATFNGEKYLAKQIESILNQTVSVQEIVVSDDNSSDHTIDILKSFEDDRIKIIQHDVTRGYVDNFYEAICHTKGDVVFLADQDDIWIKNKIQKQLGVLQKTGAAAVCTNFSLIDADEHEIVDKSVFQMNPLLKKIKQDCATLPLNKLLFGNVVQGCTYCFSADVRKTYCNIHNKEVIHDYQIMLIAATIGKVIMYNEPLIQYRLHQNNAVGFERKTRRIVVSHKLSREPFMVRFFRQLSYEVKVPHLWGIFILYYLRVPFMVAVLRRKLFGE